MSIPEVSSRSRLIAFLQKYLKKIDVLLQPNWIEITDNGTGNSYDFNEYWERYSNLAYSSPAFMKDTMGFIHLRGLLTTTNASAGTTVFTLPEGYRPESKKIFGTIGNDAGGYVAPRIDIDVDGTVDVNLTTFTPDPSGEWVSLEGLLFDLK